MSLQKLFRTVRPSLKASRHPHRPNTIPPFRPRIELLEARTVPSTLVVDVGHDIVYTSSTRNHVQVIQGFDANVYFTDDTENIYVSGPGSAGITGSGTHEVVAPRTGGYVVEFQNPSSYTSLSELVGTPTTGVQVVNEGADGGITAYNFVPIFYKNADTSDVTLQLLSGQPTLIDVIGTGTSTTIVSNVTDTVNVGPGGSVAGIQGTLNLFNPASYDTVTVDDSADAAASTVTLFTFTGSNDGDGDSDSMGQIAGLAPAPINYEYYDTSSVTLKTGTNASNVINVLATGTSTSIFANGASTVNVGYAGVLSGILSSLNLYNVPSYNTITVDDSADPYTRTAILSTVAGPADGDGDSDSMGSITGLAPAPINYEYFDTSSVTLDIGTNSSNVIDVLATGTPTSIFANGSTAVNVGNAGSLAGILGNLNLYNAPSYNTITVDDSADPYTGTAILSTIAGPADGDGDSDTMGSISLAGALVNYEYNDTATVTLDTGIAPNNVVDIQATGTTTNIFANGLATVNVGQNGSVAGIQGTLSLFNPFGLSSVTVDDSAENVGRGHTESTFVDSNDPDGDSDRMGQIAFTGLAPINYEYADTNTVTVKTDPGSGTLVDVLATGVPTYLIGNGPTTVNVGSAGSLGDILGALNVSNTSGLTDLNVDDSADTAAHAVGIAEGAITGLAPAAIGYTPGQVSSVTIAGGTVANSYTFDSAGLVTPITINGSIAGPLIIDDHNDPTSATYTITSTTVQRSGTTLINWAGAQGLQIDGGSGGNNFVVALPIPTMPVTLNGGSGANTLTGPDATTMWTINAAGGGLLGSQVTFSAMHDLIGGSSDDTFAFESGGSLAGRLDGGAGSNTLDYSAFVGSITVNLPLQSATAIGQGPSHVQNVTGSQGNDLLIGDDNGNVLRGGTGRNIIIGGKGADQLFGGGGDNLLIAGWTNYDQNLSALNLIMQEWLRTDLTFHQRVSDIRSAGNKGVPRGLPASKLKGTGIMLTGSTVHDDGAVDILTGGPGSAVDWFFYHRGTDVLVNKKKGDAYTVI
jgi:hypothetical protein